MDQHLSFVACFLPTHVDDGATMGWVSLGLSCEHVGSYVSAKSKDCAQVDL